MLCVAVQETEVLERFIARNTRLECATILNAIKGNSRLATDCLTHLGKKKKSLPPTPRPTNGRSHALHTHTHTHTELTHSPVCFVVDIGKNKRYL